jgi:hypothetical protein
MSTLANHSEGKSPGNEKVACLLAGGSVGALIGVIVGLVVSNNNEGDLVTGALIGTAAGTVAGLLVLRRIASIQSIVAGVAFGAFLPIGLCLLDGIRSGRLMNARAEDFYEARLLACHRHHDRRGRLPGWPAGGRQKTVSPAAEPLR